MGYGDIGPYGSTLNRTPNLDRMAEEGMKLTSFYVAPVCTPARASLMTGCYPKRVGLERGSWHAVLMPGDQHGINPEEITVAELLKNRGYATACIGKWHLGDYYYGLPYSNDMTPDSPIQDQRHFPPLPLVRNEEVVRAVKDQSVLTGAYTEEAVRFIRANRDRPFFLYLPHSMVHVPLQAGPDFKGKSANGILGDAIEELDWSTGRILDTIRELELERDTFVLFTSDNGPARGSAGPLRGRKGSTWEGGMREPTIAWWPGTIPPGTSSDLITSVMDVLPTLAHLAGAEAPQDRIIDGKDITRILTGKQGDKPVHEAFFYYRGADLRAVRSGPWKLHTTGALYNLDEDIGETTDVAAAHPDVVARLEAYLDRARADLGDGADHPGANVRPPGKVDSPKFLIPRPGKTGAAAHEPVYQGPIKRRPGFKRPPNWSVLPGLADTSIRKLPELTPAAWAARNL